LTFKGPPFEALINFSFIIFNLNLALLFSFKLLIFVNFFSFYFLIKAIFIYLH